MITGILIGIGIALLLVFQGMVLASLNRESEAVDQKPASRDRIKIRNRLSRLFQKSVDGDAKKRRTTGNLELVKQAYEAIGRGDVQTLFDAMTPEIEWHDAASNGRVGPDAMLNELLAKLGAEREAFAFHPESWHDAGGAVVVEGRCAGIDKQTGKSLGVQACHVWTIRAGKLAKFRQYVDAAKLQNIMKAK